MKRLIVFSYVYDLTILKNYLKGFFVIFITIIMFGIYHDKEILDIPIRQIDNKMIDIGLKEILHHLGIATILCWFPLSGNYWTFKLIKKSFEFEQT